MANIKKQQKKNKKIKNKAVDTTAKKQKDLRTRTIEINVMSNEINSNKAMAKKNKKLKKNELKTSKQIKEPINQKKKSRKSFTKILKGIGIIILIAGAIVFLCTTPLFNVTEIDVFGNENVSKEEIISLSQIKLDENMFKNLKKEIKQNIKGNAYIEDVDVKRVLPNKMQITVQERKVKFMVKLLETYAYINSQGYILEVTSQTKEVPIIEGISTPEEDIIVGKRLNDEDLNKLEVVLNIQASFEENEISRFITSINIKDTNEYTVYMAEKAKTAHLGNNTNIGTKVLYVKAILEAEEGAEGDIFVNGDLNDGFQPFFRKKL